MGGGGQYRYKFGLSRSNVVFMCRFILSVALSAVVCSVGTCQGILGKTDHEALQHFASLVTAPIDFPSEYAVVVRMQNIVLESRSGPQTGDWIYLYAEREHDNASYSVHSLANFWYATSSKARFWDQKLLVGLQHARRRGNATYPFNGEIVEDRDLDPDKSAIRYSLPHNYPLFIPIALHWDSAKKRVDKNYGSFLLDNYELESSVRTKEGLLESTWNRSLWQAKIYFDPHQGNRPARIVHLGEQPADESLDRPIQSLHSIQWKEWKVDRNESLWVPTFFRRLVIDRINDSESELEGHLTWKDSTKDSVIPDPSDHDWRESIRVLFKEDWTLDYQDWLRSRHGAPTPVR